MAVSYASPGVYVVEQAKGTRPIEGVGTSIAAFIGITAQASEKRINRDTREIEVVGSVLNQAVKVTSWTDYVNYFGEFVQGAYLPDAVYGYFSNGGGTCYIVSLRALEENPPEVTVPAKGKGNSFRIVAKQSDGRALTVSIKSTDEDTFTIKVGDETHENLTMKRGENYVGNAVFNAIQILDIGTASALPKDDNYILSRQGLKPLEAADFIGDPVERTGLGALEPLDDVRLVVCPDVMAGYDDSESAKERVKGVQQAMIDHCERHRYRFAVLDTPPGLNNVNRVEEWMDYINFNSSYAALYYPWIETVDLASEDSRLKLVPPSGHIVGVYNRTDANRGVHKAPGNEPLLGAFGLERNISRAEQDNLNPKGVNCIRAFAGLGILVWGARTLSKDGAWRYINVRRLFIFVEASLEQGLHWVVFEPNDRMLWAKVRRDVNSFLRTVWLSGALFGSSPGEAFYVKCDDELNTREIRDLGQLIIEVGLAPVKPAEFVIVRISQWAGANAESE